MAREVIDIDVSGARRGLEDLNARLVATTKQLGATDAAAKKMGDDIEKAANKGSGGAKKLQGDIGGLSGAVTSLGGAFAAVFALDKLISFGKEVVTITARFQKLQAQLETALGSRSSALAAFDRIAQFAKETPFAVEELTDTFVRLANRGIVASNEQLRGMGDLASALGKDMGTLTEAILDINNTERWNELGIKVKTEGDKIIGTFKGMTVEAARTEAGALSMVKAFGEMEGVAGGMAKQMDTLGGVFSNAGDSFAQLAFTIGEKFEPVIKESLKWLINFMDLSKQVIEGLDGQAKEFSKTIKDDLVKGFDELKTVRDVEVEMTRLQGTLERLREVGDAQRKTFDESSGTAKKYGKALAELVTGNQVGAMVELTGATNAQEAALVDTLAQIKATEAAIAELEIKQKELSKTTEKGIKLTDAQRRAYEREQKALRKLYDQLRERAAIEQASDDTEERINLREQLALKELDVEIKKLQKLKGAAALTEEEIGFLRLGVFRKFEEMRDKMRADSLKKQQDEEKQSFDEAASEIAENATAIASQLVEIRTAKMEELKALYASGAISFATFEKMTQGIEYNFSRQSIENEIATLEEKKALNQKFGRSIEQILLDLANKRKQLSDLDVAAFKAAEKQKTDAAKQEEQNREEFRRAAFDAFGQSLKMAFELQTNARQRELQALQADEERALREAGNNEKRKEQIRAEFEAKRKQIQTQQAIADKQQALFGALVNTAAGVAKALATANIPLAILIGALGAAQVAVIASKPIPKFAKGTSYVQGDGGETDDRVPAMLSRGERVVPARTNRQYWDVLEMVQHKKLSPEAMRARLNLDVLPQTHPSDGSREIVKAIKRLPVSTLSLDRQGFNVYVRTGLNESVYFANRFK